MQGSLPAGWLAFTGRESNPLDRVERFQIVFTSSSFPGLSLSQAGTHPERGLLPPSEFLPLAEAGPHITPLTFYMIEKAMADCVTWRARGADISVAVNVSAKSLVMEDFAERVSEIVRRSGASSSNLTLEVTETSAMADTQAILAVLTRLRIKGFSLSMDDFGTG